jgi:hypothetical protein
VGHTDWQDWLLQLEALRYRQAASADMPRQLKVLRRALARLYVEK